MCRSHIPAKSCLKTVCLPSACFHSFSDTLTLQEMAHSNSTGNTSSLDGLQSFEQFFSQCNKQQLSAAQMRVICQPLIYQLRLSRTKRWLLYALPFLLVYVLFSYCDSFAWSLSAVGRLVLVQVLPYWNWTPYYNVKCLVEREELLDRQRAESAIKLGKHETAWQNCALCESLENMPMAGNVSYSKLESEYLERGLPVIVTDAHQLELSMDDLVWLIREKSWQLLGSEACDVATNLLLHKLFNMNAAVQKIAALPASSSWHLQFRNCQFRAVKSSRLYMQKPYFYPLHLEPYYSSWLLIAHNTVRPQSEIYVRGLIFVQQLAGHFDLQLRPKQPCDSGICPSLLFRLNAGECLVFSSDLWILSYGLQKLDRNKSDSIATILEVDWQL